MYMCACVRACLPVTSAVTCQALQLVSGVLTTPRDVTFGDVIDGRCPDGQGTLMNNGMSFDAVKCTARGRHGLLNTAQSGCHISTYARSNYFNLFTFTVSMGT